MNRSPNTDQRALSRATSAPDKGCRQPLPPSLRQDARQVLHPLNSGGPNGNLCFVSLRDVMNNMDGKVDWDMNRTAREILLIFPPKMAEGKSIGGGWESEKEGPKSGER